MKSKYAYAKGAIGGALALIGAKRAASGLSSKSKRPIRRNALKVNRVAKLKLNTRTKFGGGGSRVNTRTLQIEGTADTHSGINSQTVKVGNWKRPKANSAGKWRYQQTYRYNLLGQAGIQQVTPIVLPAHASKLMINSGAGYLSYQNYTALESLNPYIQTTVGTSVYPGAAVPLNDRFIVNTCNLQLEFTNFASTACLMDVYVVCCKKFTPDDATTLWSRGLLDQAIGLPSMAQPVAVVTAPNGNGVQGYPITSAVHVQPRESKLFKDFWKIHKVKRLMMTGGSTETLHIDIGINKVIKCEDVRQYGINNTSLPGITWEVFTVQRGSLVEDIGAGISNELPTYGSTKVGLIVQEKYTCCGVMGNTTRLNTSVEYSNIPYGQALTNQALLNLVDQGVQLSTALVT